MADKEDQEEVILGRSILREKERCILELLKVGTPIVQIVRECVVDPTTVRAIRFRYGRILMVKRDMSGDIDVRMARIKATRAKQKPKRRQPTSARIAAMTRQFRRLEAENEDLRRELAFEKTYCPHCGNQCDQL